MVEKGHFDKGKWIPQIEQTYSKYNEYDIDFSELNINMFSPKGGESNYILDIGNEYTIICPWNSYIKAYFEVAEYLTLLILNGYKSFFYYPVGIPLFFLYNHSIELQLKAIYLNIGKLSGDITLYDEKRPKEYIPNLWVKEMKSHDLSDLWNKCQYKMQLNGIQINKDEEKWISHYINQISKNDPDSHAFRYPVDTSGNRQLVPKKKSDHNIKLNIKNIWMIMNGINRILSNILEEIDGRDQAKRYHDPVRIEDDGPIIISTNFWESEWNKRGIIGCSLYKRVFRLMIPDSLQFQIPLMKSGKEITISKRKYKGRIRYEFLFDNYTGYPYWFDINANQIISHYPDDLDHGNAVLVSVLVKDLEKVLEMPARFQIVEKNCV